LNKKLWLGAGAILVMVLVVGGIAFWNYHDQPQFCSQACHILEPYVASLGDPDSLAYAHAQEDILCTDCHRTTIPGTTSELVAYVTGDYKTPMRERKVPMEECFECHENYEKMIPLTDPEILGSERNPHDGHWVELECYICHNMHRESVDYCSGCHDPVTEAAGWEQAEAQD
jgi:cytochrome c nitrite reductase small subunit